MARIEVEAEGRAVAEGREQPLRRVEVEGDLRGMDFESEADAAGVELVEDWRPEADDLLEGIIDHLLAGRRPCVPVAPGRRTHEAGHHVHAHCLRCPRDVLHLLDRPGPDLLRVALCLGWRKRVEARIPVVAAALARDVPAERKELEPVLAEDAFPLLDVPWIGRRPASIHLLPLTGELDPVEAERPCFLTEHREGQVGPLAGEQRDRTSHVDVSFQNSTQAGPFLELSTHRSMKRTPDSPSSTPGKSRSAVERSAPPFFLARAAVKDL